MVVLILIHRRLPETQDSATIAALQAAIAHWLAIIALPAYIPAMTAEELQALRKRLGWSKREMARRLRISVSRLTDYEVGHTRDPKERPAPIPHVVELAIRYLAGEREPPPL